MSLLRHATPLVLACLLLGAGSAAAYDADATNRAAERLYALGVLRAPLTTNGSPDFNLQATLTRAEAVALIVRAFGKEEEAKLLQGSTSYKDVSSDAWYSGYIALGKAMVEKNGGQLGNPDGTFHPDEPITAPDALGMLSKFLGLQPVAELAWPRNVTEAAKAAGILTAEDQQQVEASASSSATRGTVFYLLDAGFFLYMLPEGKTVYTTYLDSVPPLLSVAPYPTLTTLPAVTLQGTVSGQDVLVVGHGPLDVVSVGADGAWTATVPLAVGDNTLLVVARDVAGNTVSPATPVVIHRRPPGGRIPGTNRVISPHGVSRTP